MDRNIAIHGSIESKTADSPIIFYYQLVDGSDNPVTHTHQEIEAGVVIKYDYPVVRQGCSTLLDGLK